MENTQKAKTLKAQAIIYDLDKLDQEINKFSNKRLHESSKRRLETIKTERKRLRKEAAILELKDGSVFGSLYNGHQKFRDMINESNNSDEIIDDIMQLIKIHGEGRLINEIITAADLPEIE